jgi:uncharacterized membrane protein YphA (DoxX/SURF4 family)
MAIDRQNLGLTVLRVCIGVFFIFEALGKIRWFGDPSILATRLAEWSHAAPPGSISAWYLQRVADPGVAIYARLVPLGELISGIALVVGFWTPLFAFIAFFMALNFQIAGNMIFKYAFLTSGYGLPVLGSTLALAIGGVRLRLSVR